MCSGIRQNVPPSLPGRFGTDYSGRYSSIVLSQIVQQFNKQYSSWHILLKSKARVFDGQGGGLLSRDHTQCLLHQQSSKVRQPIRSLDLVSQRFHLLQPIRSRKSLSPLPSTEGPKVRKQIRNLESLSPSSFNRGFIYANQSEARNH